MLSALAKAKAIARALRAARREGKVPKAIILTPGVHDELQIVALGYVWSVPKRHSMFGIPVEVDPDVEGWTVRVKQGKLITASDLPLSTLPRTGVGRG